MYVNNLIMYMCVYVFNLCRVLNFNSLVYRLTLLEKDLILSVFTFSNNSHTFQA